MRVRFLWIGSLVLAGCSGVFYGRGRDVTDFDYFVHSGERLLSGRGLHVFGDPGLQVGPLQLLLYGSGGRLGAVLGVRPGLVLGCVLSVAFAALLRLVASRLLPGRPSAQGGLVLASVLVGTAPATFFEGHPANSLVPLLWVLAASSARRGRPVRAGMLVGLSAGFEVWGVLGAAVLLLSPRIRSLVTGLAAQGAVVTALFAPFLLSGDFHMFDYRWPVAAGTLVSLVTTPGAPFGWPLRLVQGASAVLAGAAAARLVRGASAVVAVPAAVVGARLALDPVLNHYYLLEVETLGFAALAAAAAVLAPRHPGAARRADPLEVLHPDDAAQAAADRVQQA